MISTIYESQPFSQRQEVHLEIAKYFEQNLTTNNRLSYLPSIAFHYTQANERTKIYYYLEQLGLDYVNRFLLLGKFI